MKNDIPAFKDWLTACGAIIEPPTNDYEVLRVRSSLGVHVVYRNKRGRETWPEPLAELADLASKGGAKRLSPEYKDRARLRHTIAAIIERDGCECWFSGTPFSGPDDDAITIEHLCPVIHGGPNHISNLVIATVHANRLAGVLSISEKVRLREDLRAKRAEVLP